MLTCSSEYNGAGFSHFHTREVDELVLADHDLLNQLAAAQFQLVWAVKGGGNFTTCSADPVSY